LIISSSGSLETRVMIWKRWIIAAAVGCGLVITVAGAQPAPLGSAARDFRSAAAGRPGFENVGLSTSIPLQRSAGIRLPGVRFSAQVDRVRQSQHVFDRIAGVVGSHEPTGSWWPTRLGPGRSLTRAVAEDTLCQQRKRNRLTSLLCLDHLHCHSLTLSKHADPRLLDH
jgi:hypothetical protein